MTSTPLRDLYERTGGFTPLRSNEGPRPAGSSRDLAALLARSPKLASWDPVLVGAAASSEEVLEVDPARANILRSLTIDPTSIVLELGAGAGVLSRYLGETVALVDTIESRSDLAAIAAERLSDLESVRVFGGTIDDVPADPVYDLIVAIDQLRFAGRAARSWLEAVKSRLAPGGTLVLAESNRLGAKYLAGAPDDESQVVFDSIEGYPRHDVNEALTRSRVVQLLEGAGLVSRVLAALPDHRCARVVLDPSRLDDQYPSLASDLAITPAPDYFAPRPKLADESKVWQEFIAAGLTAELANSFVILAKTEGESALWGTDRLATYHSWQRAAEYTFQTDVRLDDMGAAFSRTYPRRDPAASPLVADSSYRYVEGATLARAMETASDDQIASWLARWKTLVSELADDGQLWLDLHPGNLILEESGQLTPIDLEFAIPGPDIDFTIRRGLWVLARSLAAGVHPSHWSIEISTVGDIALKLGGLMGYGPDGAWLDKTLDEESRFQQTVAGTRAGGRSREDWRQELAAVASTPLDNLPLGLRAHEHLGGSDEVVRQRERSLQAEFTQQKNALSNHIASLEGRIQELAEALHQSRQDNLSLRSSGAYRFALRLKALGEAALPVGSPRRRTASRLAGKVRSNLR